RYYHKQTRNPAFKDFWIVIHALHIRALKLIAQQKLQESEFAQQSLQKIQGILRR
ncbi:phosphotransferase family protein, partial [Acinetobacter baumannii]